MQKQQQHYCTRKVARLYWEKKKNGQMMIVERETRKDTGCRGQRCTDMPNANRNREGMTPKIHLTLLAHHFSYKVPSCLWKRDKKKRIIYISYARLLVRNIPIRYCKYDGTKGRESKTSNFGIPLTKYYQLLGIWTHSSLKIPMTPMTNARTHT